MTTKIPVELSSTPGIVDNSNATAITIDSGENVGIGTTAIPHGGVGAAKLALDGGNQNFTTGPHVQMTTDADDHPLMQILSYGHDNVSINFDCYHDSSTWKSSDAGTNFQIYKLSDSLQFRYAAGVSAGSEPTWAGGLTISGLSGDVFVGTGNLVIGTSGKGIDFSATGGGINSSSATSSLFDDYEEGTWTPTFAGVACPAVYSAHYTKIGQLVMVESYLAGDTQNDSNQFRIGGLPYTSKNQTAYGGGSIGYTYTSDFTEFGAPIIPGNTSYIYFHRIDGAAGANSIVNSYIYNKVSGNQLFLFQAFYRAD